MTGPSPIFRITPITTETANDRRATYPRCQVLIRFTTTYAWPGSTDNRLRLPPPPSHSSTPFPPCTQVQIIFFFSGFFLFLRRIGIRRCRIHFFGPGSPTLDPSGHPDCFRITTSSSEDAEPHCQRRLLIYGLSTHDRTLLDSIYITTDPHCTPMLHLASDASTTPLRHPPSLSTLPSTPRPPRAG